MKQKVYILDKDYLFIDSLQKIVQIDVSLEMVGSNADAGAAYQEMMTKKPDFLVFGYPMNFKADQLVQAMKNINAEMTMIAVLDPNMIGFQAELNNAGVKHVFVRPVEVRDILTVMDRIVKEKSNPYQVNPFETQRPVNPFETSVPRTNSNPFETAAHPAPNPFEQSPVAGGYMNPSVPVAPPPTFSARLNQGYPQSPDMGMGMGYDGSAVDYNSAPGSGIRTIRQKFIAIHCSKGGVGKTSISVNLATLLSTVRIGKDPLRVLLVDMDWDFGDVCVNMNLKPTVNVMNWINEIKIRQKAGASMAFTPTQIDKFILKYKTGLHILAAPPNNHDVVNIPGNAAEVIVESLKSSGMYDVIIFDCGNNVSNYTISTLLGVETVYEVVTMDVSAMNDLSMLIKTLTSIGFPKDRLKIIMNRIPKTKGEGDFSLDEISEALGGIPIVAKIPEYEKVRVQNNKGEPLVLSKNPNPYTEAIKMTANEVMANYIFTNKKTGGRPAKDGTPKGEKRGFFSRLFG